jgi:hypothetical protein
VFVNFGIDEIANPRLRTIKTKQSDKSKKEAAA